jgi:hypothetical protein
MDAGPTPTPIDAETLRAYLADALPSEDLARVEKALRESSELREHLESVRQNREDASLHTLGAIWRRTRLTCPSRQQLGGLLLDVLEPDLADYLAFHIDVVECPYCQANLADLKGKTEAATPDARSRHVRYLNSSRHLLPGDERA